MIFMTPIMHNIANDYIRRFSLVILLRHTDLTELTKAGNEIL